MTPDAAPSHPGPRGGAPAPPPPRLLPLAWPLFLELLLGIAVGLVGTALAARLSDTAGAGFALAHHVFGSVFVLFRVVGVGVGVVVAQSLGAGRSERAGALALAALGASTWIGGGLALATLVLHRPLMALLNAPADVLPLATPLLLALAPAMLLDAWNVSMGAVMRAHLRARDTLAVMVLMHAVHLALVAPLMFGVGGWVGLGLPGFALALLVSRVVAIAAHRWLWRERLGLTPAARDWFAWRRGEIAALAHIGVPGAAEQIAWRIAFTASVSVVGGFGAAALATHAYTLQVMHVIMMAAIAAGLSVEVLVGHLIGAARLGEAHVLVRRALVRGIAISTGAALLAALAGPWLMRLFTHDAAIVAAAVTLLWWTVLVEPGRVFNLVVVNALRAAGDARYPVAVGAVSMLVVLAGGSWLLGHVLGLGLVGVWIAYAADEWLRGLIMWRRWLRLGWVPHARASRRRAHAAGE